MVDGHNGYAHSLGIRLQSKLSTTRLSATAFAISRASSSATAAGEVIDSCLTALLNPGDNVLTPSPEYPLYGAIMAKLDCPANAYDLDEANGWQPDVADMERKIKPRTRAILLITPNNPTGAVYSGARWRKFWSWRGGTT